MHRGRGTGHMYMNEKLSTLQDLFSFVPHPNVIFIPGVVGGTSSTIFLLLSSLFLSASDFDSFSSIEFIGGGAISFNLSAAPFSSSVVAVRNV